MNEGIPHVIVGAPKGLVEAALAGTGVQALSFSGWDAAVDHLDRERRPGVLIVDWTRPDPALLHHVAATPAAHRPYLLLLVEPGAKTALTDGLAAGADDWLTVPFTAQMLRARLRVAALSVERRAAMIPTARSAEEGALIQETERSLRQQAALLQLAATAAGDFNDSLHEILRTDARAMVTDRVSFWRLDSDPERVSCAALYVRGSDRFESGAVLEREEAPLYFDALREATVIDARDARTDPRTRELLHTYLEPLGVGALLDIPVWVGGRLAGVVCHEHVGRPRTWTAEERNFAMSIGQLVSLALERQHASEQMRDQEDRFRGLFEQSTDAILLLDVGDTVLDANPAATRLLGYTRDELCRLSVSALQAPEVRGEAGKVVLQELAEGRPFESVCLRRDGRRLPVEVRLSAIGDPPTMVLSTLRDIAARQRMATRLELAERLAAVGTLAAGIAHEINNPLASVAGNLSFALELLEDSEPGKMTPAQWGELVDALGDAMRGGHRVRDIVADLATFAQGDHQGAETVSLDAALDAALRITGNVLRHRARLHQEREKGARVVGNESGLAQVFVNLLLNAAQSLPEGMVATNEIRLRSWSEGGRVFVEVADNGPGIPPEQRGRIFDPFFTTKPVGVGTGLGLAVCHGIVTALGGDLSVESETGRGTTFRVALPAGEAAEDDATTVNRDVPDLRARVLAVDDEPLVLNSYRRILGDRHELITASSAREALAQIEHSGPFDLVICDIMMPDVSGIELYEQVASADPEQAEYFIFVTGGAFTPSASWFVARFRDRLIAKPVTSVQLRRLVRDFARRREPPE